MQNAIQNQLRLKRKAEGPLPDVVGRGGAAVREALPAPAPAPVPAPAPTFVARVCPHALHCPGCAFNNQSAFLSDENIGFNGCCGRVLCRANPLNRFQSPVAQIYKSQTYSLLFQFLVVQNRKTIFKRIHDR
jgi:hypothetical protein